MGIRAFRVFMRIILNIKPYSPLKPTKVGFIFIGPNFFSQAEDLSAVNHVSQATSSELDLKVGFKELRLEPKFLNRGPELVAKTQFFKPNTLFISFNIQNFQYIN